MMMNVLWENGIRNSDIVTDKELMVESMEFQNGQLNMELSGEPMRKFYAILLKMFEDNKCENFLTVTVEHNSMKYAITIQNCNGTLTPAEKILKLENELNILKNMK